ncbi:MAG: response regulator [Desulfobacterales bacterium]|jgi:two-component system, cell cycle sensor histidine kinase and response regulator CckA|nr:response regulator [Desulfobacteraceae bacterium]MBT4365495.1 response regulator [Desulfobacteraceae bacterium]MBT7085948.1 response regulator [Desulfobacterales bacterium]MBT7697998.1 response regulator [Desulfobacterales bacterium]
MKKKILVVDDDHMMLKFMSNLLESKGHEVVTAKDGFDAINILTNFVPDIMFVDLIMPQLDGDKLCRIANKMHDLKNCYIVILSAAAAELDFDYTEIGADTCIAKGTFSSMAEHILASIKESEQPERITTPKPIMGLEAVYTRQITKELLSRNRHLETILESMQEGILEIYSDHVVYANSTAIKIFDMPIEKILTSYPPDLFKDESRLYVEDLIKGKKPAVSNTEPINNVWLNNKQLTLQYLPVKDENSSIIIINDITEQKILQDRLVSSERLAATGRLAASIAHEINSPLLSITSLLSLIRKTHTDDEELGQNIELLEEAFLRIRDTVKNLLDLSRPTKDTKHPLNINKVIKNILALLKNHFVTSNIKIDCDLFSDLPDIKGSPQQLGQVFMNLFNNAVEAIKETSYIEGEISVQTRVNNENIIITVSNNGPHIPEQDMKHIFDPFFTRKKNMGTGIGLSICKNIIEDHGGTITAENIKKERVLFSITLPANQL